MGSQERCNLPRLVSFDVLKRNASSRARTRAASHAGLRDTMKTPARIQSRAIYNAQLRTQRVLQAGLLQPPAATVGSRGKFSERAKWCPRRQAKSDRHNRCLRPDETMTEICQQISVAEQALGAALVQDDA